MLIKAADDKSRRLQLLKDLQQSSQITPSQRTWLREEWTRTQRGLQGERDAAHYIDSHYKDSELLAVLHDVRLVVDGEVAQIDHLLINRMLHFFLFETKCFSGEVHINEQGEFTVTYPGERRLGIESPIEQSIRHERILAKTLERLGITGRAGTQPSFHHAVLMHPKAVIHRPDAQRFDSSNVIKADQIETWRQRYVNQEIGLVRVLASAVNLHSLDTLREWGEKLARQHRPADLMALPEFMKPRAAPQASPAPLATSQGVAFASPKGPALAGASAYPAPESSASPPSALPAAAPPDDALRRKLVCVACGSKISFAEGKFCWNQADRFGGFQYCRQHQH